MPNNTDQQPFFNVMPEVTNNAPLVNGVSTQPKSDLSAIGEKESSSRQSINLFSNKKVLFITTAVIIFVLLAGILSWFIFFKGKSAEKTVAPTENIVQEEAESIPGVTTTPEWLLQYFDSETCTELVKCGDDSDPDRDGLNNRAEFDSSTDPNNPDSDRDGLADGDEVNIFSSDPLQNKTQKEGPYYDYDFAKGGYSVITNSKYTDVELNDIKAKVKEKGLHQPTISTIADSALMLYDFNDPNAPRLPENVDQSSQAKLDRDTLRIETIKKVGAALLKYREDKKTFPVGMNFVSMTDAIRPYNLIATNYNDPINLGQFIYSYQSSDDGTDFTLTYYSETQNQLLKYKPVDAATDSAKQNNAGSDDKRKLDLEAIRNALLIYSTGQLAPNSSKAYVFPTVEQYKTALSKYLSVIPTDPTTKQDYSYQVGPNFDTFTVRAILQNPAPGTTGYLCNQEECRIY